jgi:hypothetical protein
MTIEEVQARLRAAHARIGHEGRFALTLSLNGTEECYITHWFRPEPHAFEDCKAVASGTLAECLAGLERYIEAYRRASAQEAAARPPGRDRNDPDGRGARRKPRPVLVAAE